MTGPETTHVERLSQRALSVVAMSLATVVLVLGVALVVVIGVASSAQRNAERDSEAAAELQTELECRSEIAGRVVVAQGEVTSLVALALVALSRDDVDFGEALTEIESAVLELRAATMARATSVEDCAVPDEDE